jgi:hypothetical protein
MLILAARWHAVDACKIAAVGHAQSQISVPPPTRVAQKRNRVEIVGPNGPVFVDGRAALQEGESVHRLSLGAGAFRSTHGRVLDISCAGNQAHLFH